MVDHRRRELERRALVTSDAEDEARLIAEQVRTGAVSREAVRLAAYLGSPAARLVEPDVSVPPDIGAWLHGLVAWGDDRFEVALSALASALLPATEENIEVARRAADGLDRWCRDPGRAGKTVQLDAVAREAWEACGHTAVGSAPWMATACVALAAAICGRRALVVVRILEGLGGLSSEEIAAMALPDPRPAATVLGREAARILGEDALRGLIRAAVLPPAG